MQCKKCEYPLWNLRARQCPECGEPFLPSQQEFVINSVRFCCPHCNQDYYGTGEKGHLVPSEFVCVKCSQPITMDEMVLLPAAGVTEHETKVEHAPWLDRVRIGRVKGWFLTLFHGMFLPNRLIRGVPVGSNVLDAWWYLVITSGLIVTTSILPMMLFVLVMAALFSQGTAGAGMQMAGMGLGMLATIIGSWIAMVALTGLWGAITHGLLLITGGATHTIGRTFHAICYSVGAAAFLAVPLFGWYFAFIPILWWMVCATVMLRIGQGVGVGRAIFAGATPPVLFLVITYGSLIFMFAYAVTNANVSIQQQISTTSAATGQRMHEALIAYANSHGNAYPPFGLQICNVRQSVAPSSFVIPFSLTMPDEVPIGQSTLGRLAMMLPDQREQVADRVAAAMPSDVVAHRVGDFVFTWHGVSPTVQDPGLWVVVAAVPIDHVRKDNPFDMSDITTVMANGDSVTYPAEGFDVVLANQNVLRAKHGLPPLPDPRTITWDLPVVRAGDMREPFPSVGP